MLSFNKKMNENNSNDDFLNLRDLLDESLLRDAIIFVIMYLFTLSQSWNNIFLFLFPIITFCYSLFFRIINSNKYRIFLEFNLITYNPLGLEKKHANRLFFSALIQLVLLFWIGAESYYHPQLIGTYALFFNLFFIFFFTFGFYWILIDVWKYAQITIELKNSKTDKILSFLKVNKFKRISIANLITFILLNIVNVSFVLIIDDNIILGFEYYLPGTGIESSLPLKIPIFSLVLSWISPIIASILLFFIYKDLNHIKSADIINSFEELPEENRKHVIQNLKKINKKFFQDLNNE